MSEGFKERTNKFKEYIRGIVALDEHIDTIAAAQTIRGNVEIKGPNAYILAFAIVVASVGLNINSIPVIIGAMLISPLMGPIIGIGYAAGINDTGFLKKSFRNLVVMVIISILASTFFFLISPLELENPTELLARTNPTIYDVLIALFGGFAGIVEISRKDKGTVLSGVAIATALMPPLCTAGFGIASLNFTYFAGALYLFCINSVFIALASFIVVKYLHFPVFNFTDPKREKRVIRIIYVLTTVIVAPSIYSAIVMIKENNFDLTSKNFINRNKSLANSYIYDYNINHRSRPYTLEIFLAGEKLKDEEITGLYRSASEFGIKEGQLIITQKATGDRTDSGEQIAIQSIYERSDMEIRKREETIAEMEKRILSYQEKILPYEQLTKELIAQNPGITDISITRGYNVTADSLKQEEVILFILESKGKIPAKDMEKMREWLSVRLNFRNIQLIQQ